MGCDKNRVDAEKMIAEIKRKHVVTGDIEKAQIVVINTCAFLQSARKESIDEILSVAKYKGKGVLEKIIVSGCLPQKYVGEIADELTEADAFIGVSEQVFCLFY